MPKSEIRISKSETNSKLEIRNSKRCGFAFRIWDFEFVSDFEIRISDLVLSQLHLGWLEHELVLPFGRRRQFQLLDAPAVMPQRAFERRLARHVARQPDRRWVEARGHFHLVALLLGDHRRENDVLLQGVLAV